MSGEPNSSPADFDAIFADLDLDAPVEATPATDPVPEAPKRRGRPPRTVVSEEPEEPAAEPVEAAAPEPSKVEIITPEKTQILPPVSPQTLIEMQAGRDYLRKRGAI